MQRRDFFKLASGLLVPWEPERVYSFLPAWRLIRRDWIDDNMADLKCLRVVYYQALDKLYLPHRGWQPRAVARREGIINRANLLDVRKSFEAYGYAPLPERT